MTRVFIIALLGVLRIEAQQLYIAVFPQRHHCHREIFVRISTALREAKWFNMMNDHLVAHQRDNGVLNNFSNNPHVRRTYMR